MSKETKDTKYMLALYDLAKEKGEIFGSLNRYEVGDTIALNPRAVNAICKLLIQANFIKKTDEDFIYLTEHGVSLVMDLKKSA